MHRAFVEELPTDGHLDPETQHRFARVLRLKPGEPIELFDGRGNCLRGLLGTPLTNIQILHLAPDNPHITLIQALVSMDKLESIVQHATELGVAEIILFKAERSQPGQLKLERLTRIAQDASRQSGRAWVPNLTLNPSPPCGEGLQSSDRLFLCSPNSKNSLLHLLPSPQAGEGLGVRILIGPEGGFTESEQEKFIAAGATPVRLAQYVLRAETASLAALAQIQGVLA